MSIAGYSAYHYQHLHRTLGCGNHSVSKRDVREGIQKIAEIILSSRCTCFTFHNALTAVEWLDDVKDPRFAAIVAKAKDYLYRKFNPIIQIATPNRLSDQQVEEALRAEGILPSISDAQSTFWTLGANWWKQVFDGTKHRFGKYVFDKDGNGVKGEPGYYQGIEDAAVYYSEHIQGRLTIDVYMMIHYIACRHFQGAATNTLCDASQTFRQNRQWSEPKVHDEALKIRVAELFRKNASGSIFDDADYEQLNDEVKAILQRKAKMLNESFKETAERLELEKPYTLATMHRGWLQLVYRKPATPDFCMEAAIKLFREFHVKVFHIQTFALMYIDDLQFLPPEKKVAALLEIRKKYQEDALRLIAQLFAELEFLHPYIDGQGRTDLLLASGLLCKHGLHPFILDDPYFSSSSSLEEWIEYLKGGLIRFEKECCSI